MFSFKGVAQEFADNQYYLVDSLLLEELTDNDRQLIDNSLKMYHSAKEDTSKVNALNDICENMMDDDWTKYQFFQYDLINKALANKPSPAIKKNLLLSLSTALNNIGYMYMNQGDISLALQYYHKSLKLDKELGDKLGEASSFNNIGLIYKNQGNIEKCLEYYHACLSIRESEGYKKGIATSLHNIGVVYMDQNDNDKALNFCLKAKKIREEIGDKFGLGQSLNFTGFLYKNKKQYGIALKYWKESLALRKEIGDIKGIAESVNNIGGMYRFQIQQIYNGKKPSDSLDFYIEKALHYYKIGKEVYEKAGIKQGISNSHYHIGYIQYYAKNYDDALKNALKALDIAQEIGFPDPTKNAAHLAFKIYKSQGNAVKSLRMLELYIVMKDSTNNEVTQKATIRQQTKYEFEKVQAVKDKEHEKQLEIEKEAKEKQKVITYATAGGLGMVGIFLFFVMNRLKVTRRQKVVIEEAHHELEEKNQEIMDSITYAKRIQSAILPPTKVVKEYLKQSFILYKPKDIVAGDFYWMEHKEGKVLFAAADCTGHGVPGAMVSVVCNNGLNRSVREHGLTDPGEILNKTREIVIHEFEKSEEEVKDGMDIALCSLELNSPSWKDGRVGILKYAGANNPLWIIRDGAIIETKANKQPIGKFDNPEPYTTHIFELQKGDSIYIFSDGYVDQFGGEKGKKFKAKAFRELLLNIQDKNMEEQKLIIDETFETWRGSLEQIDDVCVIGVKI